LKERLNKFQNRDKLQQNGRAVAPTDDRPSSSRPPLLLSTLTFTVDEGLTRVGEILKDAPFEGGKEITSPISAREVRFAKTAEHKAAAKVNAQTITANQLYITSQSHAFDCNCYCYSYC